MSEEFDIRIGTQFDTKDAESQLSDFIKKYDDKNPLDIKLNVTGEEGTEGLEATLRSIKALSKSIKDIEIKVNTNIGNSSLDLFNKVGNDFKQIADDVNGIMKKMTEDSTRSTEDAIKESMRLLNNSINKLKSNTKSLKTNIENLKLDPNINSNELEKYLNTVKQIEDIDYKKVGLEGVDSSKNIIADINKDLGNMITQSKKINSENMFKGLTSSTLLDELNAVKTVMSAKNIDTSGIDILIAKTNTLSKSTSDIKTLKESTKALKSEFNNMKVTLDLKDIKSSETAIKHLEKAKASLNEKMAKTVDSSSLEGFNNEIKLIDIGIDSIKKGLNEIGNSTIKGLDGIVDTKNTQNMQKEISNINKELVNAKGNFDKLKGSEFADSSKLVAVEGFIKSIDSSLDGLDMKNLDSSQVSKLNSQVDILKKSMISLENSTNNLQLETKFNADFSKVKSELNGLKSAIIGIGGDTSVLNQFENQLNSIANLPKINMSGVINQLKSLSGEMKKFNGDNFQFKNIDGGIKQCQQLGNEVDNLNKKLSNAKDTNIANGLEKDINNKRNAIKQLTSEFDNYQRKQSESFGKSNDNGNFSKMTANMTKGIYEVQSVLNKLGSTSPFKNITSQGGALESEFNRIQSKIVSLSKELSSGMKLGNLDLSQLQLLESELGSAIIDAMKLSQITIDMKCDDDIAEIQSLKQKLNEAGVEAKELDVAMDSIGNVKSQFGAGTMKFDEATKEIKNASKEIDKFNAKLSKGSSASVTNFGNKVEGFFSTIRNSFNNFGMGMMINQALSGVTQGIKSAILDLDSAMTDVKRVLPNDVTATATNLKSITEDARSIAIDVGQSTEDVIKGMASALQAGANTMEQATSIAKSSAIFQNVTDMSAENSSKSVASLISQYYSMDTALSQVSTGAGKTVKDYNNLTEAMDIVNYAGNNFAISSEGVTQALQRGGAVLSNYGISLSDSVAMISGANESIQNPERVDFCLVI